MILFLCQRELADHCSSLQPECVGPWGCTQGKALGKTVEESFLAYLDFLCQKNNRYFQSTDYRHLNYILKFISSYFTTKDFLLVLPISHMYDSSGIPLGDF